ncbi:hypothetical protein [Salinimicrobium sp. HB62]|uniref:hypothetical protein n=1 Tax=Salinimicrobium sp. HB62 TaxID=3077781 RepID=UPI002D77CDFB|nr:hypothetical protein [Salinimicrobium sp. HB62]
MKKLLFIILVVMYSCNDGKTTTSETSERVTPDSINADTLPPGNIQEERDAVQTEKEEIRTAAEPMAAYQGRYRKIVKDSAGDDCNCNCIEIAYDRATEWCIDKDKLYMSARCKKTGENTADVYFVSSSREISPDRPLPWEEFDTNTPVATLTFQPDGSATLDWLGFSSNGEVLTDYALYGKKTLEGTYKKE